MDRDKQIEEMARDLNGMICFKENGLVARYSTAEAMYNTGYRKQSVGEWIETDYKTVEHGFVERRGKAWLCTNCRHASKEFNPNMKFCPECGAQMKGGQ